MSDREIRSRERPWLECPMEHGEVIRCYVGNDEKEWWAQFCPSCGEKL